MGYGTITSELRNTNLERLDGGHFDVLVVGGGINGAVSAASLTGRGLSVALVDRGDFAGVTSQESSNLVWGGFKYLESYDLILVRKLCMSRNRLMKAYPANIQEIPFVATLGQTAPFPQWLAGLGSYAYWGIGNFKTAAPRMLSPEALELTEPLIDTSNVKGGLQYADALLTDNDARFVFSFIRTALDLGATAANYVELTGAERAGGRWQVELRDTAVDDGENGATFSCSADTIVNAAGPYADPVNNRLDVQAGHRIVHSKGIHLIVEQLTPKNHVLAFFDDSRRLFYVIPMGRRSVIGTTDTRVDEPTSEVTDEDRRFVLDQINARLDLERPLKFDDIIAERCGTRPLVVEAGEGDKSDVEWTSLSRKHEIDIDRSRKVVTVFGGKLTDCLNVGEEVADAVGQLGFSLPADQHNWYGEPPSDVRRLFYRQAHDMRLNDRRNKPGVEPLTDRLWRRYGRRAFDMLDRITDDPAMGEDIMGSADYLRVELHHTAEHEMVVRLDDFLRRRSKISQVVWPDDVRNSDGLSEVAEALFGPAADRQLEAFLRP